MGKAAILSPTTRISTLVHSPAGAVAVDEVVLVNGRVCIAYADVAADDAGEFVYRADEVEVPKAAVTITAGAVAYWDATAEVFTTAAVDNTKCGMFRAAAAEADEVAYLALDATVTV